MKDLLYEPVEPSRVRTSLLLGSLDLELPDGGTKFGKIEGGGGGAAKSSKLKAPTRSTSPQPELPTQPWASKWSLLRHAAESGNRRTVEIILKRLEVHLIKESWRLPPLHLMCESGNVGGVRKLLKHGANPLNCTQKGMNCLHLAAEYGHHHVMLLLLQHEYEEKLSIDRILNIPCARSPNWTVLHYAAARNQAEVLSLLLARHNIPKDARDDDGNTALMIACENRSEKALDLLLQNRAAVSLKNNQGKNCLSIAASKGYDGIVEKLLASEVNSRYQEELIQRRGRVGEHHFVNSSDAKDAKDIGEIWTPLHHAAAHNHGDLLRLLATHPEINIDARDRLERTPLMVASERGHALAISVLLRNSADISLRDSSMKTCLHAAASNGHTRVLATLLTIDNIDIDALDFNKNTALIIACEFGHTEAVNQILQRKSALGLVKQQSSSGKAVIRKRQWSTDSPAPLVNAHMVNKDGRNCLHMAASRGRVDVVTVLLDFHDLVDIDSQDVYGNTALILAAKHGETQAFELLLRRGANVLLCNADGCNCLHIAAQEGCYEVVKVLLVDEDDDEFWGVEDGEVVNSKSSNVIAESAQAVLWKKIFTGDVLAWNIVRLQLMEKESHQQFTCLHLAGRGRHIEMAVLLLKAYLILALKVRGFTRHPRDPDMMPQFLTQVRDVVSVRYTISASSSETRNSDSEGSRWTEDHSRRIQWINASEDFVIRNRLIIFCTTYKHVHERTHPSKYFAVNNRVFGEIHDDNLLVSTFVDAYMEFISYCNAGDRDQRTLLHHIALADFREDEESGAQSMERLVESPAIDINAVDLKGDTPLHLATETGNICVVRQILHSGRVPNLMAENDKKKTPCSIAFAKWKSVVYRNPSAERPNEYETMLALLEHAVIKTIGESSEVPLVFQDAETQFLKLLFEHLESSDRFRALDAKKLRGVTNLKRHQATLGGLTLLHYVAYRGLSQELKVLLSNSQYQAKVNMTCSFGDQTPLHFAVDKGHMKVVDILLTEESEQGQLHMWSVRTTDDDAFHETPLEKAVKYKLKAAEQWNDQEFNLYKDIEQMLMSKKDVKEYIDKLYRDRQVYVDASNAILVGAALIASVTFAGWLQPPLGYVEYTQYRQGAADSGFQSFVAVQQYPSVRAFWIFNSLSFFFAVAAVVCGAGAVLQMQSSRPSSTSVDVKKEVRRMRVWLMVTSTLMAAAIMCVLGAFGAAGYAVLPPEIKYRTDMFVTVSIGVSTCVVCLYCFFRFSGIVFEGLEWFLGSRRRPTKLRQLPSRFS